MDRPTDFDDLKGFVVMPGNLTDEPIANMT